jgi:hypothetical protein
MDADSKHVVTALRHWAIVVCICLMSAVALQAQAQPDLIVSDLWEASGWVHFSIQNTGAASAKSGHTTGLTVDGTEVDSVVVSSAILPGGTYKGSFPKYFWKCTADGSHTIVVRADVYDTVSESNEKNNSRTETWVCDVTPPQIIQGPQATDITETSASIVWTTNEASDSVVRYGTAPSVYKFTRSHQNPSTAHKVVLDGLTQDTKYYYRVESTDAYGNTVQSQEHTFRTSAAQVARPDLTIADIWLQNDLVYFRIANSGNASAPSGHIASLYVDGQLKATHEVTSSIAPNGSLDLAFKYAWVCPSPQPSVRVEADSTDVIEETNEQNNGRTELWSCEVEVLKITSGPSAADITQTAAGILWTTNQSSDSKVQYGTAPGVYTKELSDPTSTTNHKVRLESLSPGTRHYFIVRSKNQSGEAVSDEKSFVTQDQQSQAPDLVVDAIWKDGNQICARIKNSGAGPAAADHRAGLYTGDHLLDSAPITVPLGMGQTADVTFRKFYFECREALQVFRVTADIDDAVAEQDETNNSLDETFVCDVTVLRIVSGPFARAITTTTADIVWDTNKPSDSKVLYDSHAGVFGLTEGASQEVTQHAVRLAGLAPETVYQFQVRSANGQGQSVESKVYYFRTAGKSGKKPNVTNVTFEREPTESLCYRMTAAVEEEADVDKVEFFVNGALLHTDYSRPFQAVLTPGLLGIARGEIFRPWTITAVASAGSIMDHWAGLFEPAYECDKIIAEFEWPFSNERFYIAGDTAPAGTEIPIRVRAYRWDVIIHDAAGIEHLPSVPDVMLEFTEWPLEEVRFYVNGADIGTVPSQSDHLYDLVWDAERMPVGTHVIRADAVANGQCIQTITQNVRIQRGAPEIVATRQVWREENAFRIRLNIRNTGTVGFRCDFVRDNVDGLQPIHDGSENYSVSTTPSADGRECSVFLDVFSSGSNLYEIQAGRTLRLEYYTIPIQFPGPGSPKYEIGEDPVVVSDTWGLHSWSIPCRCVRTEDGHLLDEEIDWAIEGSDYQLVTNPSLCASEFGAAADLLSEIARLAYHRKGILGYPSGIGADDPTWVRDCIRMWGASMKGSDRAAGRYLSNGYLLLVGETEILPSWDLSVSTIRWSDGHRSNRVQYSDLPYGDMASSDNVPELNVGRIIGDSAGALMQAMQASIASSFDRTYGVATSGAEGDWENFVGRVREICGVWDDQAEAGGIMTEQTKAHHWSAYVHKEQLVSGFDFPMDSGDAFVTANLAGYGMSAIRVEPDTDRGYLVTAGNLDMISTPFSGAASFVLPFSPGDALTAGDIDDDGVDEIIAGNIALDKLTVVCDPPNTSPWTYWAFDAELEPGDAIACGRLFEFLPGEVVVVARPVDGGTVDIYEYASSVPLLARTYRVSIPFSADDGLAIAEIDGGNPGAEIVIGSRSDERIYVYDREGHLLMEIPCEPYTAYDSLVAGDLDGDGADELAVLIDDVIDSKRRLHIFEDGCVAYDATAGWQLVRNRSSLVYSRFLAFDGARTTSRSGSDGVTCDDLDGDGKQEICLARNRDDRLYVLDGHYSKGWKDRYLPVLQDVEDLIDLFVLVGHGNPGGCSPFNKADIGTLSLAGPLVFTLSCLTGNYEGQWEWLDSSGATETHTEGDDGFAETFFEQGAAVYIGATEVSSGNENDVAGPAFFRQWDPSEPAGKAFGEYRRCRAATGDTGWKYWALEYNYYGDLKFGAMDGGISAAAVGGPTLSIAAAEPLPTSPEIEVPQYEVVAADGRDRVTIPGGDVLIEGGRPMVPTYRIEWEIPSGVVVQDVRVRHRGGLQTDVGLVLPVAIMRIDASSGSVAQDLEALPGWYPGRDLNWQVIPKARGASTLAVTLYPFEYNAQTTESRFYRQYTFDIETLDSGVRITTLLTDKLTYATGEPVTVKVGLRAEGAPQDAFVGTVVRQYGSDELIAGLLLDSLSGLRGTASYSATWDSIAAPPGFYYIETKIVDTAGQVLTRETSLFRLLSQR